MTTKANAEPEHAEATLRPNGDRSARPNCRGRGSREVALPASGRSIRQVPCCVLAVACSIRRTEDAGIPFRKVPALPPRLRHLGAIRVEDLQKSISRDASGVRIVCTEQAFPIGQLPSLDTLEKGAGRQWSAGHSRRLSAPTSLVLSDWLTSGGSDRD